MPRRPRGRDDPLRCRVYHEGDQPPVGIQDLPTTQCTTGIRFQEFTPEHLDDAVNLSRQAGWPHRREDWAMVLGLSSGIVAISGGKVVGTALVTRYGAGAATINMVIVDTALRGQGIGRSLMELGLQAGEGRELRLIATREGLPLYEKLGFRATDEILQHQGVLGEVQAAESVEWAAPDDGAVLAELDQAACGMDRGALIRLLEQQGRLAVLRRAGRPQGFAALRAFGRGEVAGPVVAADAADARALLRFLFAGRAGAFMRVDTTASRGLAPWLAAQGLAHAGGGIAMRRGGTDGGGAGAVRTFALASQALG